MYVDVNDDDDSVYVWYMTILQCRGYLHVFHLLGQSRDPPQCNDSALALILVEYRVSSGGY